MTQENTFEWLSADSLPEPLYVKKHSFLADSLTYTGRGYDRMGVAGDPVPYTIRGDNFFTSVFLLCFVALIISLSNTKQFVVRWLKSFYYPAHVAKNLNMTSGEMRFQLFLVLLASLLYAIAVYMYARDFIADTYLVGDYTLVGIIFASFTGYFLFKNILYVFVNSVFFTRARQYEWLQTILFLTAMEGVLLFPIVLVQVYFDLSFEKAVYYYCFVLILVKILTFYKCWSIFFRQTNAFLQNFLYFCTLEIVPILFLGGGLSMIIDILKITI